MMVLKPTTTRLEQHILLDTQSSPYIFSKDRISDSVQLVSRSIWFFCCWRLLADKLVAISRYKKRGVIERAKIVIEE